MKTGFIILMIIFFTACKTEFRQTIERYPNGKISVEYIYPDKKDKTRFTYVAYYEDGDTMFKSAVKNMMFIGQKINYFDSNRIRNIETLFGPTAFDDSLYDCYVKYFLPSGQPLKSIYFLDGVKSFPSKYWLDSGVTLTGVYYDSSHRTVLWQWFDKENKEIKQKKDSGSDAGFSTLLK